MSKQNRKNFIKLVILVVAVLVVSGFTFLGSKNSLKSDAAELSKSIPMNVEENTESIPSETKIAILKSATALAYKTRDAVEIKVVELQEESEENFEVKTEIVETEENSEETTEYMEAETPEESVEEDVLDTYIWEGPVLNSYDGIVPASQTPSGYKETYYNLNMSGVISNMRALGYSEEEYPYWVRDDGVKMFGDYVMVALIADKGEIVPTTRGMGMVVDYCPEGALDIAVTW